MSNYIPHQISCKSVSVYWVHRVVKGKISVKPLWSGFASLSEARANLSHYKKMYGDAVLINPFGHLLKN